jgi:hypothetical protein
VSKFVELQYIADKTFLVKYQYHHTFLPYFLAVSRVSMTSLVLPSSIVHCKVVGVHMRPTAILMEDSDVCRQNCDKVDVNVQHSASTELCKAY